MSKENTVAKLAQRLDSERARLERDLAQARDMVRRGRATEKRVLELIQELDDTVEDLQALEADSTVTDLLEQVKQAREAKRAVS